MSHEPQDQETPHGSEQVRAALHRAGIHFMRAGYELLAGVSAFLEELATQRDDRGEERGGPTRIELED